MPLIRRRVVVALAGIGLAYLALLGMGALIMAWPSLTATELDWDVALASWTLPVGNDAAILNDFWFSTRGAPYLSIPLVLLGAALQRPWRGGDLLHDGATALARAAVLVILPWLLAHSLKSVVGRDRPELGAFAHAGVLPQPSSGSFPSGHTAIAASLCLMLVLCTSPARRRIPVLLAALVIAWTSWSRMVLGMHYVTDTLGSALFVPVVAVCLDRLLPHVHDHAPRGLGSRTEDPPTHVGS